MAAVDEILQNLPIDQLAQQVGAEPQEVQQAAQAALPALFGGLQANAQGGGSGSLLEALGQHNNDLLSGGVDLGQVDPAEGQKIASHIFGSNEEQVYSALGGSGAGGGLIKKLIPILAPIVLSYLANKVLKGGGGGGLGGMLGGGGAQAPTTTDNSAQGGPGSLDSMLQDVLGGAVGGTATQQAPAPQQSTGGGILDVLGGLLGGGRR